MILYPPKDVIAINYITIDIFDTILRKNISIANSIYDKNEVYDAISSEWDEEDQDGVLSILSALLYGFQKIKKNKSI